MLLPKPTGGPCSRFCLHGIWVCFWNNKNISAELLSFCEKGTAEIFIFGDFCFCHCMLNCEYFGKASEKKNNTNCMIWAFVKNVLCYCVFFDMLNQFCRNNVFVVHAESLQLIFFGMLNFPAFVIVWGKISFSAMMLNMSIVLANTFENVICLICRMS